MADRYNVRNVAQKEVYDSYMGILRISPNSYIGKDIDDPTDMLNTLVDFEGYFQDHNRYESIKVRLSDSDGNILPVTFLPNTFKSTVLRIENGVEHFVLEDVINITTDISRYLYASNNLTVRSTIHLENDTDTDDGKRISRLQIATKAQKSGIYDRVEADYLLAYPIESPNDDDYFNYRNCEIYGDFGKDKLGATGHNLPQGHTNYKGYPRLVDYTNPKPRFDQMQENLLLQSKEWYDTNFPIPHDGDTTSLDHRVKVAGRYIHTYNKDYEEIPVLYTRDYVLGHYDGHSYKKNKLGDALQQQSFGDSSNSDIATISDYKALTRLSWLRFDDLVWDCLDEVLSGKVRHTQGRYTNLGTAQSEMTDENGDVISGGSIMSELFGDLQFGGYSLTGKSDDENKNDFLKYNAPLMGAGVQKGIIMYNAMPFHRYWFHRCRQVATNLQERARLEYEDSGNTAAWHTYTTNEAANAEAQKLKKYFDNGLITAATMASLCPIHTVAKDFLLCNGNQVTFENFPNISLTNENLFVTKNGKPAGVDKNNRYAFRFRRNHNISKADANDAENTPMDYNFVNVYKAMQNSDITNWQSSSQTNNIVLPNLFALHERHPRFIRGMQWGGISAPKWTTMETDKGKHEIDTSETSTQNDETEIVFFSQTSADSNANAYTKFIDNPIKNMKFAHNVKAFTANDKDSISHNNNDKDVHNVNGIDISKNFNEVKLHFYNFDHLTETRGHNHLLFSENPGASDGAIHDSFCYYYSYDSNNGGNTASTWVGWDAPNKDFHYNSHQLPSVWANSPRPYVTKVSRLLSRTGIIVKINQHIDELNDNLNKANAITIQGKSQEFLKYCFQNEYKQLFYGYTPVPTCGLVLFNRDVFNSNGIGGSWLGTIQKYELDKWKGFSYWDGAGAQHDFRAAGLELPKLPSSMNGDWDKIYTDMARYARQKDKRKQLMIKLNESEARIPISYRGQATFKTRYVYTYQRKRSWGTRVFKGDKWDTETEHFDIKDVGGYEIRSAGNLSGESNTGWRCLTSLPHIQCDKLACGNVANYWNPTSYWDNHNVTDMWKPSSTKKSVDIETYGLNDDATEPSSIQIVMNTQSPYPSHMLFLPLIRL